MGLGKTLNMIALIVAQKEREPAQSAQTDIWLSKKVKIKRSYGTLVICPSSVVGKFWKKKIYNFGKSWLTFYSSFKLTCLLSFPSNLV